MPQQREVVQHAGEPGAVGRTGRPPGQQPDDQRLLQQILGIRRLARMAPRKLHEVLAGGALGKLPHAAQPRAGIGRDQSGAEPFGRPRFSALSRRASRGRAAPGWATQGRAMNGSVPDSFDLYRIFVGDHPPVFLLEILFRTTVLYLYVLLVLRLIGKRGMGQLSPFEFTIIIALGSAVGDPMFYPEVPLLHGLVVVTAVVALTRAVTFLSNRSEEVEKFLEGQPCRVVSDGELRLDAIDSERISREELFMLLREKGVSQLGQVRQAFLEPSGAVSAFRVTDERCRRGLPIIPPYDEPTPPDGLTVRGPERQGGIAYACWKCGHVVDAVLDPAQGCTACGGDDWTPATRDPLG